jgi:4-amino-4-deoxy-L-arabinose transferase-like glycosyltransferase
MTAQEMTTSAPPSASAPAGPAHHHNHHRRLAVPVPRRFPVALGLLASTAVFATSLRALPPVILFPLAAAWLGAFVLGALLPRQGRVILTVLAGLVKASTVVLIVWALTHSHSPIGPHGPGDWVPLGMLNAATGLWLLAVIRHRAR